MGCQSSKSASKPAIVPARTLLACDEAHGKSPKAQPMPELPNEASEAIMPVTEQLQLMNHGTVAEKSEMPTAEADIDEQGADVIEADQADSAEAPKVATTKAWIAGADVVGDKQSKREPTSRVHKDPQGWQEEGILFPHEGIRFLMQELSDVVGSMDPLPAWKWENLSTWYQDYFYTVVHHHHDAEEKIYLPWIQSRMAVPDKISADHPELMRAMEDLSMMLKKGAAIPASSRAEHLKDVKKFLAVFFEDMQQHLAEEEETIPRLLRDGGFTQEDEASIVGKIIEGLGLDGNKKTLPTMLHAYGLWAGDEKAEAFVSANLPLPIQFLHRNFWMQDFRHRHLGLLLSIAEGVDTNPFASKWFC